MERLDAEFAAACPTCKGLGWVHRDAPLGHPDFGRAFPCVCQTAAEAERGIARLRRYSNLGILSETRFSDLDERGPGASAEAHARYHRAIAEARSFAEAPAGSLLLAGGHGTGKTILAAAAANQIMGRGVPVLFVFVPDLLDQLRGAYSNEAALSHEELFEQVKNVPVLILDDIGAHSGTPWAEEKLFQIVNHRYVNGFPTLVTSAVPLERLDGRLQSKLADPRAARAIDMGGKASPKSMALGGIDPTMLRENTFAKFQPHGKARDRDSKKFLNDALEASRSFAENPNGWLALVGGTGCGKTHLAVAIANRQLEQGGEVFFASVPDLLDHLRVTYSPDSRVTYDELFDRVRQAPLLILDDYGAENETAWANEKLHQIIVHRHNAKLPTVITMLELDDNLDSPITSRLHDTRLVKHVGIEAPSYRPSPHGAGEPDKARKKAHKSGFVFGDENSF